ncbi:unnamed protein product [Symbiodinium pilosum]|uniref:Ubiquitin-like domain-containing protein n=1 Tax=Symbiodinium pilosum TaxID=2952 RepID=A0A812KHC8_SYMPI|nr:unnamed protein product [Symbiodinium pilosum]
MAAVAAADVTFEVSLLSGAAASIACPPDASLGSLQREIAEKLGLLRGDEWPSMFFLAASGETEPLQESVVASELADRTIIAGVNGEPDWCSDKQFKKSWIHGRHCGMEEDSEDIFLKIHGGGTFSYEAKYHSHDAECGYQHDMTVKATGTWRLALRKVKDQEPEEVIAVNGTATRRTVDIRSTTRYYDDYTPSESASERDTDEESNDEDEKPPKDPSPPPKKDPSPPPKPPQNRHSDKTVTEEFKQSFSKADLLTPDKGRGILPSH